MIKAVIFDYGGVISLPQKKTLFYPWAEKVTGLSESGFRDGYLRHRIEYDRGDISGEEMYRLILSEAGKEASPELLSLLTERDLDSWASANLETFTWAKELRQQGVAIGILTNMPLSFLPRYNRVAIGFRAWADAEIISAAVRLAKPDPTIYHLVLSRLKIAPHEAFFLDDTQSNIDAARAIGLHAERFISTSQARAAFEKCRRASE